MTQDISIHINQCTLEGINVIQRTKSLRKIFITQSNAPSIAIPILHDINLSFKKGDKVAFVGNNGSGKSSLLKLISGIYPPKVGNVIINGTMAALIEMGLGLEPELTGRQNIKILLLYSNNLDLYSPELENKIIEFSELGEKIECPVNTYSSGMISRLTFATSIFQNTDILLIDEVFATGDASFVKKSLALMERKIRNAAITIIVSHQEQIIKDHCNRCVLLESGRVTADDTPDKVLDLYSDK